MAVWKDERGREWTTTIDVGKLKAVKDRTGLMLTDTSMTEGSSWAQISADPCLLCDVMWTLTESQATGKGVDFDGFIASFMGDAADAAANALWQAVADFSPAAKKSWMQSQARQGKAIQARLRERLDQLPETWMADAAMAQFETAIQKLTSTISSGSATRSAELSASTLEQ